jgi:hypothetical protein
MARPSFSPSVEQRRSVKAMAGLGLRHQDIAVVLEIAEKTLRRHFRVELTRGAIEANAKVLQTLYGMATSGENTAATIFYAKTRCGLRERPQEADSHWMPPPQIIIRTDYDQKKHSPGEETKTLEGGEDR